MNIQSLIDNGMLVEVDGKLYKNDSMKNILTLYNAVNPEHPIRLGTLATYFSRHDIKHISLLSEDQSPAEDDYS